MELFVAVFFQSFNLIIAMNLLIFGHCIIVTDIIHAEILLKSRFVGVYLFSDKTKLKLTNWHGERTSSALMRRFGSFALGE